MPSRDYAKEFAITGNVLIDGQRVGTFCILHAIFGAANTDKAFPIKLGRTPNGYIQIRSKNGGRTYDASTGATAWTGDSMTLRNDVAGEDVWLLIL